MDERLRQVPIFAELSDADLIRICGGVQSQELASGEVLFSEGDSGDTAYVVVGGEVEVVKKSARRETLLALRGPGDVIGEMALLQSERRSATVRARGPAELLIIPKSVLDAVLGTSPSAVRSVFSTLLDRLRENIDRQRQSERLAQLGTLTAGIAHELNNPAAGARRAAEELDGVLDELAAAVMAAAEVDQTGLKRVADMAAAATPSPALSALARSDEEAGVEAWLEARGVADAWRLAPGLVAAGFGAADLDAAADGIAPEQTAPAVRLLAALAAPRLLAREAAEGTRRISEIVAGLKSHAYLDRAPIQDVDIHRGLDDSLMLLAHKLRDLTVVRDYGDDLPALTAMGGALNQVWTNLLDNAAYELRRVQTSGPQVIIRTRRDGDDVVVEVEDNGPGIPPEIRERIFDAFFTTKPPGEGTGQGLNMSYQIVVFDHGGELTVESEPGRTVFRVALPAEGPLIGKEGADDAA